MDEIRCAIEVREVEGINRLVGVLLPFEELARDRAELFERGSLSWPAEGVVLRRQHVRAQPILRFTPVEVDGRLLIDTPVPDTIAGRDAVAEIRAGVLTSLSVEFRAVHQNIVAGVRRIGAGVLVGAGLVDAGSYQSATATVEARAKAEAKAEWDRWRREVIA